jgi:DNA-binding NarL/FixJ family response regulator
MRMNEPVPPHRPDVTDAARATETIALVIIEDNALLRDGLRDLLDSETDFRVLAAAAGPSVFDHLPREHGPSVLLLDVGLPDDDSVRICRDVHRRFPQLRVLVMGMLPHDDITLFVEAGVAGFVRKDATAAEFLNTVRHVAHGATALPRALTEPLFAQIMARHIALAPDLVPDATRLTAREREIVALLGEGLSNKDIAIRLHIAIHTVKSHVHNILEKLALRSRLEVVAFSRPSAGAS